jgi:hypothetical protein
VSLVRAGGRRAGQPFDLSTARRTRRLKGGFLTSSDLREGVAGGARKEPEAAVSSSNGASRLSAVSRSLRVGKRDRGTATSLAQTAQVTGVPNLGRTLMRFRQGLNLNRGNFSDVPDFDWVEPELERM